MIPLFSSISSKLRRLAVFSITGFALVSTGCALGGSDVGPRVEVINRTQSALTAASILSITGTYDATCDGRNAAGTDSWTASVTGGPAADELSVRMNDSNCTLRFNDVVTADGAFIGAPPIVLNTTDTYQGAASAYALDAGPLAFYGNAKISSLLFATDFTLTLLVSDTPVVTEVTKTATFATVSATVVAGTVPAPDYTVLFTPFELEADVDNIVRFVSGYAQLTDVGVAGLDYGVYQGALTVASTLGDIETAFAASVPGPLSALTTLQLPATSFGLIGADLDATIPTQRTIIIRNVVEGVSSYQLLLITFTALVRQSARTISFDDHSFYRALDGGPLGSSSYVYAMILKPGEGQAVFSNQTEIWRKGGQSWGWTCSRLAGESRVRFRHHDAAGIPLGASVPIRMDRFNVVVFTFDGVTLRGYVAGKEASTAAIDGISPALVADDLFVPSAHAVDDLSIADYFWSNDTDGFMDAAQVASWSRGAVERTEQGEVPDCWQGCQGHLAAADAGDQIWTDRVGGLELLLQGQAILRDLPARF